MNSTPFVRQYGILNNQWGALLCRKEYPTNGIHQNSRGRLLRPSCRTVLAIKKPPEFIKFKDMTACKVGSGFIWRKARKDLQWNATGGKVQAGQRKLPSKVEEDLLAEVQRLRAKCLPKNLQAFSSGDLLPPSEADEGSRQIHGSQAEIVAIYMRTKGGTDIAVSQLNCTTMNFN